MFQVVTKAAKMPTSCRGRYRRVAVVETETADVPAMISDRARGVRRIVRDYGACSVGRTERCAYARAMADARDLAADLNAGR